VNRRVAALAKEATRFSSCVFELLLMYTACSESLRLTGHVYLSPQTTW